MIPPADKGAAHEQAGNLLVRSLLRFRRWIVACLIVLWIAAAIASHIPQEHLPPLPTNGKILHVLGFLGLATLLQLALGSYGMSSLRRNLWVLVVFSVYAALDEGTQPYFHRHGCVSDWLLDTASAALSLAVWEAMLLALKLLVEHRRRTQHMHRRIERLSERPPQAARWAGRSARVIPPIEGDWLGGGVLSPAAVPVPSPSPRRAGGSAAGFANYRSQ